MPRTGSANKELVARRAIVAATQARPGRPLHRAHRRDRPFVLPLAGLALTATGLICMLVVHVHAGAVNVHTAGFIVMTLGLAWLWMPVRDKRAVLRRLVDRAIRYSDRAMTYLDWDPDASTTVRCSLDELFGPHGQAVDDD